MEASDRPVRVLVVEDDQEIAQVLQRALRLEGYEVRLAGDGVAALDEVHAFLPDVIVLDLGLPRMDGIDVARRLRKDEDDTPILMLTARDALDSRVEGLDVGADDYLVKPFEWDELLARVRALLRRGASCEDGALRFGDLELSPLRREARRGGRRLDLTSKEFDVLHLLVREPRRVFTRAQLIEHLYDDEYDGLSNVIDVFVSRLRRKINARCRTHLIDTRRGVGYRLAASDDPA